MASRVEKINITDIRFSDGDPSALRDLPVQGWPRLWKLGLRAVRRTCPLCDGRPIFRAWFTLAERCPRCAFRFEREEGYFLGAYAVNLIVAEFLGVGLAVYLLVGTKLSTAALEALAILAVVGFPIAFFPFSRTFWMAFDLLFDPDVEG